MPRAFGSFALLRRIAAGTRGEVFAALRPVEIERFCALKILSDAIRARPDFVPALRDEATAVVRRIHASGITIVLVEHLLRVVNQLATRIVVLDQGRALADGEPGAVMADPAVIRAYLGSQAGA